MILKRAISIGITSPYGTNLLDSREGQIMNPIIELQEQEVEFPESRIMKRNETPSEMKVIKDWHTTGYMEVRR